MNQLAVTLSTIMNNFFSSALRASRRCHNELREVDLEVFASAFTS